MAARANLRAPNRCVPKPCADLVRGEGGPCAGRGGGGTLCRAPCATLRPNNFCEIHRHGIYVGDVPKQRQINEDSTHAVALMGAPCRQPRCTRYSLISACTAMRRKRLTARKFTARRAQAKADRATAVSTHNPARALDCSSWDHPKHASLLQVLQR